MHTLIDRLCSTSLWAPYNLQLHSQEGFASCTLSTSETYSRDSRDALWKFAKNSRHTSSQRNLETLKSSRFWVYVSIRKELVTSDSAWRVHL